MKFVARPMFDGSNILNASEIAGLLAGKSNTGHAHAWSEITSKPTTFAPAAHVLATSTGLGAEHTVSGLTAGQVLKAASATTAKFEAVKWGEITSVPSSFTPSAHTHAWSEITSKPTTFAPSAHTHPWSEVTSKPNVLTQSRVTANVTTAGWYTIAQGSLSLIHI